MNSNRNQLMKNLFKTFNLSFTTKELIESLDKDESNPMVLEGKRVWTKEDKPKVTLEIDKQLRKNFKISEECKYFLTIYSAPFSEEKDLEIKEASQNVSKRIIIDTISEKFNFKGIKNIGGEMEIKRWEALSVPPFSASMFNFKFSNKPIETSQQRKGFRSQRRTKNISKRYLMVFDYLIDKEDFEKINNIFNKKDNYKINTPENIKDFEKAYKDLIS